RVLATARSRPLCTSEPYATLRERLAQDARGGACTSDTAAGIQAAVHRITVAERDRSRSALGDRMDGSVRRRYSRGIRQLAWCAAARYPPRWHGRPARRRPAGGIYPARRSSFGARAALGD